MALQIEINWLNYNQYKITDIHPKTYEQVKKFMLEHFRNFRLFQVLKVHEEPDVELEFLRIVQHILENECSLVIRNEMNNEVKGVALLKCMTKLWRSWLDISLILRNERFKEICEMVKWCLEQQASRHKNNPGGDSLHIFSYHLSKELNGDKEFLPHLFEAICEVARHMHMPRVTYLCLGKNEREEMDLGGFQEMVRVIYSMYLVNGRRPFDRLRDINEMYGLFYERKVEPLQPFQEMVVRKMKLTEADPKKGKEAKGK